MKWLTVLGGVLTAAIGLAALALVRSELQLSELEREGNELYRRASQLVGQHDAHLTALSAIALASNDEQRANLFLDVSATISRYYSRVEEAYLIPVDRSAGIIASRPLQADLANLMRETVRGSTGLPVLLPHPVSPGHYFLVKPSPKFDAILYALVLGIDATTLIDKDSAYWSRENICISMSLLPGEILFGAHCKEGAQFSQTLASASQPLLIQAQVRLGFSDLLPPWQALAVVLLAIFAYASIVISLQQRSRIHAAEHEIELRRVESQLAHAMRVNSMGEMASGMAHELTQPLTAILAQLQAGLRLLARGDTDRLSLALQDAVEQTRRGAAILERLRNWSQPKRRRLEAIELREVAQNVCALLAPEAKLKNITINIPSPDERLHVLADQVEMEQVIHNLIRNSMDALDGQSSASVDIGLWIEGHRAVVSINDNGPGVDPSIQSALFTPFTTTRTKGTGLGLALCQRLVERAGGEISHVPSSSGTTFRVVLPLANHALEVRQ